VAEDEYRRKQPEVPGKPLLGLVSTSGMMHTHSLLKLS
jgi:hypothetical protein